MQKALAKTGAYFASLLKIGRSDPIGIFIFLIVSTSLSAIGDRSEIARFSAAMSGVVTVIAQYALNVRALGRLGLLQSGKPQRGIIALVVQDIVTTVGTFAGFLLIVPGIVLGVRWSIAVPLMLSEDAGIIGAIGKSWHDTKQDFWPILCLLAIIYLPIWMVALVYTAINVAGHLGWTEAIVLNLLINIFVVAGWYGSIAIYRTLHDGPTLTEVFA